MSKTKFCRRSFRPTVKTCLKNDWIDCCSSSATSLNWTYSMLCSGKSLYQYLAPGCDIKSGEGLIACDQRVSVNLLLSAVELWRGMRGYHSTTNSNYAELQVY